jgi:hypothetical protein
MNINFGNFQNTFYPESEVSKNQKTLSGDFVTPVALFSRLDVAALSPESLKDINSHVRETSIGTRTPESVLHQVSINLACTTEQLSNIMTWLASTGSAVNIKIDTP